MSDPTKLPSDIGGQPAGAVDTHDHGMRHWERQANAIRSLMNMSGLTCTDEMRRAAEELGERYKDMQYFEITTSALRKVISPPITSTSWRQIARPRPVPP